MGVKGIGIGVEAIGVLKTECQDNWVSRFSYMFCLCLNHRHMAKGKLGKSVHLVHPQCDRITCINVHMHIFKCQIWVT